MVTQVKTSVSATELRLDVRKAEHDPGVQVGFGRLALQRPLKEGPGARVVASVACLNAAPMQLGRTQHSLIMA
jgi:hypothetical protein